MPKTTINPINRRLKKAEVKDYIDNHGAKLHEEYTKFFFEDYGTGYVKEDLVYELSNGDFIYVFDPKGHSIPGKGNYWERDRFLRFVRWTKKVKDDYKFGRASSVDHWRFYSKHGSLLINNGDQHLATICKELNIDNSLLDFSYESLGRIDTEVEKLPYGKVWETLYDALVFYVGEVIIKRIDGKWEIETVRYGEDYPFVTVEKSTLYYMPVNIVWQEIGGLNPCNLRKATADEIRTNAIWHPKNNK
jgi:hypothetical protein